jgi:hypothetical protein
MGLLTEISDRPAAAAKKSQPVAAPAPPTAPPPERNQCSCLRVRKVKILGSLPDGQIDWQSGIEALQCVACGVILS